jgi:hypothetical protein
MRNNMGIEAARAAAYPIHQAPTQRGSDESMSILDISKISSA